jgi:hypothetical protein
MRAEGEYLGLVKAADGTMAPNGALKVFAQEK